MTTIYTEHEQKKLMAQRCFIRHDHNLSDHSPEVRENCGACCLNGYHPKDERKDFINYAGWARLYIQAGKFIPKHLRYAFLAELASSNRSYAEALKQDIKEYGINVEFGSFKNAIQDVLEIY